MQIEDKQSREQSAYIALLQYLNHHNKPVSPHELALQLNRSRVTIQSALKRLLKTGWVIKEGASPKAFYRAVDPFASKGSVARETTPNSDPRSIDAFIAWCRGQSYHVPEIALEYLHFLKVK